MLPVFLYFPLSNILAMKKVASHEKIWQVKNQLQGKHLQYRNCTSVEISSHIQIFIPVKESLFLGGIQKSGLMIEMTILKI